MAESATNKKILSEGWRASARKVRVGEFVHLESLEGNYAIRPQKLDVESAAEYRRLVMQTNKAAPGVRSIIQKRSAQWLDTHDHEEGYNPGFEDIRSLLSDKEWEVMMESFEESSKDEEQLRLLLLKGVAETTLDDPKGNKLAWTPELVEELLQFEDVAREIALIVQRWNAPLQQKTEEK